MIYSLNRKQLGTALLNPTSRVGIVGILKLDGVYEAWNEILEQWTTLRCSWNDKYETDCAHLWSAAYYGHVDLLGRMKTRNPAGFTKNLNQGRIDYLGRTGLAVAVERDNYATVKFLIESGADEDIPDFALNRPLHLVKSGKVAELLKYNENLNASGLTAIEIALEAHRLDVIKVFIKNGTNVPLEKLLEAAVKAKSTGPIDFLARYYVIKEFEGDLLRKSIENGSYEVFKYLIGKKCPIPEDCLKLARLVGNVGILRYLEKKHTRNDE